MKPRRMTSKKAGTCIECNAPIQPGQSIFWVRGKGAWHVNCQTASYQASQCTACSGSGRMWNNSPCRQCDGTGSPVVQKFAKQGGHPVTCSRCTGAGTVPGIDEYSYDGFVNCPKCDGVKNPLTSGEESAQPPKRQPSEAQ